ncbi:MAG: DbpA RNA binding domain-containing protein, partial [Muribaculaceae bacterium]|nr:DbpA RNA binding domain-containing protein [Muribaculaceae bacterium]
ILSLEFNRLLDYYKDATKIDVIDEKPRKERGSKREMRGDEGDKDRRTAGKGMARLYVNLGKRDGFYAGNLIELLNKNVNGHRVDVGRIDLMPSYSLFDVKKSDARKLVEALTGADFAGKRVYCEVAEPDKDYGRASARKAREKVSGYDGDNYQSFKKKNKGGRKSRK